MIVNPIKNGDQGDHKEGEENLLNLTAIQKENPVVQRVMITDPAHLEEDLVIPEGDLEIPEEDPGIREEDLETLKEINPDHATTIGGIRYGKNT